MLRTTIGQRLLALIFGTKFRAARRFEPPRPLAGHKCIGKNDQNGEELQRDTPAHQLLAEVRISAFHQRAQAVEQYGEYSERRDGRGMVEKRLHPAYPPPVFQIGLSLWTRGGNCQDYAETTRHATFAGGFAPERARITHLKFALFGKCLNPCDASYLAPAPRRISPHTPAPCAFRPEAQ
ncbi:hypothetical protein HYPGJ_10370 [Hyphomicrobium sp. GJ21]|nr:hypothetical protein HYPGJ_10370 [Hyphomicrobium sp. GJ21]